jgi:hypothetical protein
MTDYQENDIIPDVPIHSRRNYGIKGLKLDLSSVGDGLLIAMLRIPAALEVCTHTFSWKNI